MRINVNMQEYAEAILAIKQHRGHVRWCVKAAYVIIHFVLNKTEHPLVNCNVHAPCYALRIT